MSLNLTTEWDKVFPKSDKVNHKKVTFKNHFGIELAADMYLPKDVSGKLPAIAVAGPYGAVKEQSSGLYAQEMAERGFIANLNAERKMHIFNTLLISGSMVAVTVFSYCFDII